MIDEFELGSMLFDHLYRVRARVSRIDLLIRPCSSESFCGICVYILMEKMDSRGLPEAALNERRRRAVKLRLAGVSIRETASQWELSTNTVMHSHRAYEEGGWAAVKVKRGYRTTGLGRLLSAEQEQAVQWLIQDRTPDQLKMNYALWTRQAVSELIEVRTGGRMQVRTVSKYLKRWGYTPQKPLKKTYEQLPAAVDQRHKVTYSAIAKRAKT